MSSELFRRFGAPGRLLGVVLAAALLAAACGGSGVSDTAGSTADDVVADGQENADAPVTAPEIPENPVLGRALAQFADPDNDAAIGQRAPDLHAVSLKGQEMQIDQADGRGKIYGFFAHWCPHCQTEVPLLVDYLEANRLPDNVDFHAVSTAVDDSRDNFPPVDWFDNEDWPFPVLDDSAFSAMAAGFGLPAFPYFVVVGGDGAVVQRIAGGLADEAAIVQLITIAEQSAS